MKSGNADDARGGANFRMRLILAKAAGSLESGDWANLITAPSMCPGSTPRSRVTRMLFRRGMGLAGDMRQKIDPKLPVHLPILIADS
jgi:hypothetical protein